MVGRVSIIKQLMDRYNQKQFSYCSQTTVMKCKTVIACLPASFFTEFIPNFEVREPGYENSPGLFTDLNTAVN